LSNVAKGPIKLGFKSGNLLFYTEGFL